jgi:predicted alpha/beta-fold hydrolase
MHTPLETQFGRISTSTFEPSLGLSNAHLQTILPKYFLLSPRFEYVNERITTPDHDFIDLAWAMPAIAKNARGLAILFHGLEGSSDSHYIKHLIESLLAANIGSVVMHFRGCSTEPNLTPKAYHSGATYDPEFIVPLVKNRYPHLPLFGVGFSLGGNMLMKLMANCNELPMEASVCISAPLNLAASSASINHGFSNVYQRHLMKSMKSNLLAKMKVVDMSKSLEVSTEQISKMQTFLEFDNHITAALHGFRNAQDYYERCSALPDLPKIKKPTLIIHAQDDPFMDSRVIPTPCLINENVAYELSPHGGHVGFLNTLVGKERLWLPTRITNFISELLL